MSAAAKFKAIDVERAVKGAEKAGLRIGRVLVDARGTIVIEPAQPGKRPGGSSWDDVLP